MCRAAALVLLLVLALPAAAQPAPSGGAPPGVRVALRADADTVSVGERFTVTLTAEHPPGLLVAFPDPGAGPGTLTVGDLELIRRLPGTGAPGGAVDSARYEAAAFGAEAAVVPPLRVRFTTADEDTFSAATDTLRIPLRSVVPPGAEEIQDLAPLVAFARPWWVWALLVVAALAVLGLAYWLWRRRRARGPGALAAPPRSPYEEAVDRLRALEAVDPAGPDPKPYYVEIADVLRTYLARRLGVSAREETTGELVRELRAAQARPEVPADLAARVADVLAVADLAKYADARPGGAQGRAALDGAREVVESVEAAARARQDAAGGDGEAAPAAPSVPAS